MKRDAYLKLLNWKNKKRRKPLLLQGARQVGKTYLVHQFGENEYKKQFYFNFEKNKELINIFQENLDPMNIIDKLSLYIGEKITDVNTLIFFDEIQVAPKVLTSLKYFCEEANTFHIIAAGSLLGVSIGKESSFPVGKIDFMTLCPMSFKEFLIAINEELILNMILSKDMFEPISDVLHKKLLKIYIDYLYIGGMPEVVQNYIDSGSLFDVRDIQNDILSAYRRDFSKYSSNSEALKTLSIWNSIPLQLAKPNKKFVCAEVLKKSRLSTFENSIEWLKNAGLVNIVQNIKNPKLPLKGYIDSNKFKLYLLDTGLLGAMLEIATNTILESKLFSEYKGAFIENYMAMELKNIGFDNIFYWSSKSDAEVDFIISNDNNILPIEVKSGLNRNIKSLRSYQNKYNPKNIIRISPRNFEKNAEFINIPLYAAFLVKNI